MQLNQLKVLIFATMLVVATSANAADRLLPEVDLTPGDVRTTDITVICSPGYSRAVRHTSGRLKHEIYAEYGLNRDSARYEIDHLIPLGIGGADPTAQVDFFAVSESHAGRLPAIRAALKIFGPSRLARETDLSRQCLSKLAGGEASVTEATMSKIEQAIAALEVAEVRRRREDEAVLAWLSAECLRISMRQVAQNLGVDAGCLSRILAGLRHIPRALIRAVNAKNPQASDAATF